MLLEEVFSYLFCGIGLKYELREFCIIIISEDLNFGKMVLDVLIFVVIWYDIFVFGILSDKVSGEILFYVVVMVMGIGIGVSFNGDGYFML